MYSLYHSFYKSGIQIWFIWVLFFGVSHKVAKCQPGLTFHLKAQPWKDSLLSTCAFSHIQFLDGYQLEAVISSLLCGPLCWGSSKYSTWLYQSHQRRGYSCKIKITTSRNLITDMTSFQCLFILRVRAKFFKERELHKARSQDSWRGGYPVSYLPLLVCFLLL